jgi:hypothetical protein
MRVPHLEVEPELNFDEDWVTYPIEARVMEVRIPPGSAPARSLREYICGSPTSGPQPEGPRLRNSQQDVRLMDAHPGEKDDVKKLLGGCDASPPADPESYLRIRDYLFLLR